MQPKILGKYLLSGQILAVTGLHIGGSSWHRDRWGGQPRD